MLRPLFALLTLLSLASPALAQTQMEMNDTAHSGAMKSDAKLNQQYKQLMGHLAAGQRAKLIRAELRWIAFRDAQADFEEDRYRGGSIMPLIYWNAVANLTDVRTKDLAATSPGAPDPSADEKLNKLYKKLVNEVDDPRKQLLLKAELAWIAFRDAEADFEAARFGGHRTGTIDRLTRERAGDIQTELNADEEHG